MLEWWHVAIIILGVFIIGLTVFFALFPFKLWFRALVSGAHVKMIKIIGMKMRKVNPTFIIEAYIRAKQGGINLTVDELETHYMANGDVLRVVEALIAAYGAKIALSPNLAKSIDISGKNVVEAVKNSVAPKILDVPEFMVLSSDGVEIFIRYKITVRVNLTHLVGGAGEETVIARVSEKITNIAASAKDHKQILKNPDYISARASEEELDRATAYEVISIDITGMRIGRHARAALAAEEAESNKKVAISKAEEERAMAMAEEHKMKARTQEMKAQLLKAESEVPLAIAEAFRKGNISIREYQEMENLVADTEMRRAIGSASDDKRKK
ncbi:MAG: flotillin-like FloA family protein [Firmicutes bacterium]|nr:flotillin-like FloA family protein [Bacillota bacterium]MCL2771321.1 flotillin-like FloA family protein [Bacillota bacterium]